MLGTDILLVLTDGKEHHFNEIVAEVAWTIKPEVAARIYARRFNNARENDEDAVDKGKREAVRVTITDLCSSRTGRGGQRVAVVERLGDYYQVTDKFWLRYGNNTRLRNRLVNSLHEKMIHMGLTTEQKLIEQNNGQPVRMIHKSTETENETHNLQDEVIPTAAEECPVLTAWELDSQQVVVPQEKKDEPICLRGNHNG